MRISSKVLKVLQAEKISAEELFRMLDSVAFTSMRGFNRRFDSWLFQMQNNLLTDMQRVDLLEIGRGQNRMLEEHEACDGEGCKACGWSGQVSRAIVDSTATAMNASV